MSMLAFTVYGVPAPQGSHKAFALKGGGVRITDSNVNLAPWREHVHHVARGALPDGWAPLTGPVAVTHIFHLPRPKSAPKTRDILPTSKPDIEKLIRGMHDAFTSAGVWKDDSQVVSVRADKFYAVGPDLPRIYDPELHMAQPCVSVVIQDHWLGPICRMCGGTGQATFHPGLPAAPYQARCPACNGHGREPS